MPQQHIWLLPQNWGYLVSFGTYFFKNFTKIFQKWLFWSVWESSICKVKKEETIHFTHFNMAIDYVRGVFSRHTLSPNRVNCQSSVIKKKISTLYGKGLNSMKLLVHRWLASQSSLTNIDLIKFQNFRRLKISLS
jgi:hypothetical protein